VPTVLVADEDRDIRDLVAYTLAQAGHVVVTAESGPAALEQALATVPDVAVLDVMMPGMSGFDVCRQIRATPATREVPVILLTARAQASDVATGLGAGADDHVTKPFSPRELASRVATVLARGRRSGRGSEGGAPVRDSEGGRP
jgi:DNA-binding response OmpR family regulator